MTVSYPYSLAYFADILRISSVIWDVQRNDQFSGTGDGRVWQAELATPLWIGTVSLIKMENDAAKQIAAMIRKLHGAQEAMFIYDPLSKYPQFDPDGSIIGTRVVTIGAVAADLDGLSLRNLPPGYRLTVGDKMQIAYSANPTRYAFLEVSENVVADGQGTTPVFGVFPHVSAGIAANLQVTLVKPACRCVVVPGSHNPGTAAKMHTEGAGFKVIQKK
ncbi:hypothetical protein [Rhizobium sp. WW_1]|jgi:hypothetical protein|uniref:hypothetical protein n=1 Tax=Rhizobium sp. WW_1 TaxID=1907375 RepID=UPI0006457953|nr:hypothetical protein [Rhizobium sp. WW_1]RKD61658.1 hypothetical protein BJ928_107260 [Rhizobium sp. WW_1]